MRLSQIKSSFTGTKLILPLSNRSSRQGYSLRLKIDDKLVLRPTGDMSTDHIGGGPPPTVPPFVLEVGVFEVGREAPADLVIPAPTVSGRHALIRITSDRITVTDLESTNGTYVDQFQLRPMKAETLNIGSQIIFGDEHLAKFVLFDEVDEVIDV